ncbi:MAG: hypothetical protein ACNI27_10475 [Desulfovibrio sp.]
MDKTKKTSLLTSKNKRTMAKAGMAASLGTLVATGLLETNRSENLKRMHLWSGFALVGFSYWHYSLYQKSSSGGS